MGGGGRTGLGTHLLLVLQDGLVLQEGLTLHLGWGGGGVLGPSCLKLLEPLQRRQPAARAWFPPHP